MDIQKITDYSYKGTQHKYKCISVQKAPGPRLEVEFQKKLCKTY